jgi:putative glutamine amidotransferase
VDGVNKASSGRPLVAVPARFSATTSALRHEADAVARRLLDAVLVAGGEPLMVHPSAPGGRADDGEVASRLAFADALLLPGGADIAPAWYGRPDHPNQYGVNVEQDAFDLAAFRAATAANIPVMAICRGAQLVNVACGGTLVQDMDDNRRHGGNGHHRNRMHHIAPRSGSHVAATCGASFEVSCFHHQAIDAVGAGLAVTARAEDGTVEAYEMPSYPAWFAAVQWHPEDTAAADPAQLALFRSFVAAARAGVDSTAAAR